MVDVKEPKSEPDVEQDLGDIVYLRCACGTLVTLVPMIYEEEQCSGCDRILWARQTLEVGYKDG